MDRFMKLANENAKRGIKNGDGGPFGAIILDENLNIKHHFSIIKEF